MTQVPTKGLPYPSEYSQPPSTTTSHSSASSSSAHHGLLSNSGGGGGGGGNAKLPPFHQRRKRVTALVVGGIGVGKSSAIAAFATSITAVAKPSNNARLSGGFPLPLRGRALDEDQAVVLDLEVAGVVPSLGSRASLVETGHLHARTPISFHLEELSELTYPAQRAERYVPAIDVYLICFSVVDPNTFDEVLNWVDEIDAHTPTTPKILVGLKADLVDDAATLKSLHEKGKKSPVKREQAMKMAREMGAAAGIYVECSSVTQEGLHFVFEEAARVAVSPSVYPPLQTRSRACKKLSNSRSKRKQQQQDKERQRRKRSGRNTPSASHEDEVHLLGDYGDDSTADPTNSTACCCVVS